MNIAKHMEAILIVGTIVLTSAAAIASPAGKGHTGDLGAYSVEKSATLVVNAKGVSATLDW